MFSFLLGALGGAALSGGYVLLNTSRSGEENQRFVKEFYYTTKANIENVQDKANNMQNAMDAFNAEVSYLQLDFLPDVMGSVNSLAEEADVYMRRINDGITVMTNEVDAMNMRIAARKTMDEE